LIDTQTKGDTAMPDDIAGMARKMIYEG